MPEELDKVEKLRLLCSESENLRTLANSNGWKKVIVPALEEKKQSLLQEFLEAKEHLDFIRIQQAINAIDNLLLFVPAMIEAGERAEKELKELTSE